MNLTLINDWFFSVLRSGVGPVSQLSIPHTILLVDGVVHKWWFTSKKNKTILQKKRDKLTTTAVCSELLKNRLLSVVAVLYGNDGKKVHIDRSNLLDFIATKPTGILQEFIEPTGDRPRELFYVICSNGRQKPSVRRHSAVSSLNASSISRWQTTESAVHGKPLLLKCTFLLNAVTAAISNSVESLLSIEFVVKLTEKGFIILYCLSVQQATTASRPNLEDQIQSRESQLFSPNIRLRRPKKRIEPDSNLISQKNDDDQDPLNTLERGLVESFLLTKKKKNDETKEEDSNTTERMSIGDCSLSEVTSCASRSDDDRGFGSFGEILKTESHPFGSFRHSIELTSSVVKKESLNSVGGGGGDTSSGIVNNLTVAVLDKMDADCSPPPPPPPPPPTFSELRVQIPEQIPDGCVFGSFRKSIDSQSPVDNKTSFIVSVGSCDTLSPIRVVTPSRKKSVVPPTERVVSSPLSPVKESTNLSVLTNVRKHSLKVELSVVAAAAKLRHLRSQKQKSLCSSSPYACLPVTSQPTCSDPTSPKRIINSLWNSGSVVPRKTSAWIVKKQPMTETDEIPTSKESLVLKKVLSVTKTRPKKEPPPGGDVKKCEQKLKTNRSRRVVTATPRTFLKKQQSVKEVHERRQSKSREKVIRRQPSVLLSDLRLQQTELKRLLAGGSDDQKTISEKSSHTTREWNYCEDISEQLSHSTPRPAFFNTIDFENRKRSSVDSRKRTVVIVDQHPSEAKSKKPDDLSMRETFFFLKSIVRTLHANLRLFFIGFRVNKNNNNNNNNKTAIRFGSVVESVDGDLSPSTNVKNQSDDVLRIRNPVRRATVKDLLLSSYIGNCDTNPTVGRRISDSHLHVFGDDSDLPIGSPRKAFETRKLSIANISKLNRHSSCVSWTGFSEKSEPNSVDLPSDESSDDSLDIGLESSGIRSLSDSLSDVDGEQNELKTTEVPAIEIPNEHLLLPYSVGDTVVVVKDVDFARQLAVEKRLPWHPDMSVHCGKSCTVLDVTPTSVLLSHAGRAWTWPPNAVSTPTDYLLEGMPSSVIQSVIRNVGIFTWSSWGCDSKLAAVLTHQKKQPVPLLHINAVGKIM